MTIDDSFHKKNWEVLIEIEGIEALSGPVRDSFIWLWSRLHFLQWLLNVVVSLCQLSQFWIPTDHWPIQRVYQRKQCCNHLYIVCLAHQSFYKRTTDDSGFQGHNVELTLTCVFIKIQRTKIAITKIWNWNFQSYFVIGRKFSRRYDNLCSCTKVVQ